MKSINWAGVIVAVVLAEVIGILWYGMAFKAQWMALMNIPTGTGGSTTAMVLGAVNELVVAVGLSWLVGKTGAANLIGGVTAGLLAAIFFACTTDAMAYIYAGENTGLFPINFGYLLVSYAVMGAAVAVVRLPMKSTAAA
jgi:hypothetical protein